MWIIVEGVDGSGKTSLCGIIAEQVPTAARTHLSAPKSPSSALSECVDDEPFSSYTPGGQSLISDRHHWGCPVYGPILRPDADEDGYGEIGKAGFRYAELYIASRGGATVFVDVSAETAQGRIRARGDDNHDPSMLVRITPELIDRYHWLMPDAPTLGMHVVEPCMDDLPARAQDIINIAAMREAYAKPLAEWPDYVGITHPKTLIVCEPTKEARLEILAGLDDDGWADAGFCSSQRAHRSLHQLAGALDYPQVIGVGTLPSDADAFVYDMGGKMVESLSGSALI